MFNIVIESIARADPFDDQSRAGVQYCSEARLLLSVVVAIGVCQLCTDGFCDRRGYVQHDTSHGSCTRAGKSAVYMVAGSGASARLPLPLVTLSMPRTQRSDRVSTSSEFGAMLAL